MGQGFRRNIRLERASGTMRSSLQSSQSIAIEGIPKITTPQFPHYQEHLIKATGENSGEKGTASGQLGNIVSSQYAQKIVAKRIVVLATEESKSSPHPHNLWQPHLVVKKSTPNVTISMTLSEQAKPSS